MAHIMACSAESLPDSLMDDFARCVHSCEMNPIEMVYFSASAAMNPAGCVTRWRSMTAANYEGREDLGNTLSPATG